MGKLEEEIAYLKEEELQELQLAHSGLSYVIEALEGFPKLWKTSRYPQFGGLNTDKQLGNLLKEALKVLEQEIEKLEEEN